MKDIRFSWDEHQVAQNTQKHGVPFEEATSVFFDENATEFYDPDHSGAEGRFLVLGIRSRLRLLVVHYALRAGGMQTRVISARRASKNESKRYTREEP